MTSPSSRRRGVFVAAALAMLLVAALVVALTAALSSWRADDPAPEARTALARVGDGVAVVIVAADPSASSSARRDVFTWMLVALGVSVVPVAGAAWVLSRRLTGDIDAALAELDTTEHDRRRRLDEVIHELRTPLAVAGTNLELAASDPALDPETQRLIDAARRANERMSRTVDDLAEHGRLAVHRTETVDVAATVRAVVTEHAGPAQARAIRLAAAGESALPVPAGDPAAVHTALGNLVDNAVRLAPGGSTVLVSCGQLGHWAWAAVTDEGPGIAEADQPLVFDRGWRGRHDRDRDRGDGQHGLGLTIARQLVEANDGRLTVSSGEHDGSTFALWLPLADDARDSDVVAADGIHPVSLPWLRPAIARSS